MFGVVEGGAGERLVIQVHFAGAHAEAQSGVDGVHHMQIMRPGFGPVFPGVHGGVGADAGVVPIRARAVLVVLVEGVGVTGAFVAEQVAKRWKPVAVGDQPIPIVMADFMAKVAEQGAVRFAHLHTDFFAVGVVGFLDVEGDQAVGMAGGRRVAFQVDADEVEGQAVVFVDAFGHDLQAQADQLRHQPALGGLDLAPALGVFCDRQVGNGAIQAARHAQRGGAVGGNQPVAGGRAVEVGAAAESAGVGVVVQQPSVDDRARVQ